MKSPQPLLVIPARKSCPTALSPKARHALFLILDPFSRPTRSSICKVLSTTRLGHIIVDCVRRNPSAITSHHVWPACCSCEHMSSCPYHSRIFSIQRSLCCCPTPHFTLTLFREVPVVWGCRHGCIVLPASYSVSHSNTAVAAALLR